MLDVCIRSGSGRFEGTDAVGEVLVFFEEELFVGRFEVANIGFREAAALEADEVEPPSCSRMSVNDHERRDVLNDFGTTTDDGVFANATKLMNRREAGDNRVIFHRDVPCEAAVIGKDDMATQLTVVRDVRVTEKQVVGADTCR